MPVATFPTKLYQMLEDAEVHGFTSVVSWLPPDQKAFKVHDKETFAQEIMPRYFQQTKYKSFIRQLNLWSFQRILRGPKAGGYWHMFFMKSNQPLAESMIRCTPPHRLKEQESKAGGKDFSTLSPSSSTTSLTSDEESNEDPTMILTPLLVAHSNSERMMLKVDGEDRDLSGRNFKLEDYTNGCQLYRGPDEEVSDVLEFHEVDFSTTKATEIMDVRSSSLTPQELKYILVGIEMGKGFAASSFDRVPKALNTY